MEPSHRVSKAEMMIVITAGLASLLQMVDTSIVNVAIPSMMGNLGATLDDIGWVVTGYIISNAIILPISGWISTRYGRRRYFITSVALFTASSVACGLSPNLGVLIFWRAVQGIAGGAILPTSQALIQEAFPGRIGLGSALFGMVTIIGPTIGPPLGGYLTDHFGWRMIFNINLPIGLLAVFLSTLYVTEHSEDEEHAHIHARMKKAPVDTLGLTLLVVGMASLQYVLEKGQHDDWFSSHLIVTLSIIAGFCLPFFAWWEWNNKTPIVDLKLYRSFALVNGTIIMAAVGAMLYVIIFIIPIFAANILNLDARQTGNLFMPAALASGLLMPPIGILIHKYDPRWFMFWGVLSTEIALLLLTGFTAQTGYWDLFWPLMIRGLGMSAMFIPINAVVLGQFKGPALGQAAGIMNLARQLGGSFGIAIFSTLFSHSQDVAYENLRGNVSPLNASFTQWARMAQGIHYRLASEVGMHTNYSLVAKEAFFRVKRQAFVIGFDNLCWYLLLTFALAAIPIFFMKRPEHLASPSETAAD
jgi:DHA2 family multidrug resistance protein